MTNNWKIKDNKIICYNLYHKLHPFEAEMRIIEREVKRIRKKNKCSELEATEVYKTELKELLKKEGCKVN